MSLKFEELLPVLTEGPEFAGLTTNTIAASINDPTKAPGRLPFPMDTILDEFADSYCQLHNAREMLDMASHNKALTKIQRERLTVLRDKIAIAAKSVREVAKEVDQDFTLEV